MNDVLIRECSAVTLWDTDSSKVRGWSEASSALEVLELDHLLNIPPSHRSDHLCLIPDAPDDPSVRSWSRPVFSWTCLTHTHTDVTHGDSDAYQSEWRWCSPEEKSLARLFPDDVQFIVVSQCPGHLLISHVGSVLSYQKETNTLFNHLKYIEYGLDSFRTRGGVCYLMIPPQTGQTIRIHNTEDFGVTIFPADVILIATVRQKLIDVIPQQSAVWWKNIWHHH